MDRDLIETKLESLRRCLERIRKKAPTSEKELERDPDLQDIIALNLQRAVQLCVDLAAHLLADANIRPPATMADNFQALCDLGIIDPELAQRMKKAVGFRNVAVHSYRDIDWQIVFSICRTRLIDFDAYASAVMRQIQA